MKRFSQILVLLLLAVAPFAAAQDKYQTPPQELTDIYLAPPVPRAIFNPDATRAVVTERNSPFIPLAEIAAKDE